LAILGRGKRYVQEEDREERSRTRRGRKREEGGGKEKGKREGWTP
jgi:hypothetical protein